jgi:type I restriction enzyme, S subunit
MSVPKLRFPEFRDDWRIAKIGDFVESYKGGAPLTPSDFVPYSDYAVIPKKAISEGMWLKIDVEKPTYCKENFYKENLQSVVDKTYLIMTLRDLVPSGSSIGYIVKYENDKSYILAQGVYGLKLKKTIISDFLIHFSNTGKYRKMMQSVMVGSTQVHIRNSVYLNLPISILTLQEQQKIADCLSSIDKLIIAQTKKIDTLKTHKKGLMQQLFPALDEVKE